MVFQLVWIAGVLKEVGLKVAEVPGWESRGRASMGQIAAVMCHHTAGPPKGNMPSLGTLIDGRSDLPGPLAQLGLGRDGTFYVIAAGRANHAGQGQWSGVSGNSRFIGIEAENTGLPADPWPNVQMEAYRHGVAAILAHLALPADACIGHKEYALPAGRKNDPSFDMNGFRQAVAAILAGSGPSLELIPAVAPHPEDPARPTVRRNDVGMYVRQLQLKLNLDADGFFGPHTEAAVREFQRGRGLVPDGIVGPRTWSVVDQV